MFLKINELSQTGISDLTLVKRSKSSVKSATRDLEFLTKEGITPEFLTEMSALIVAFDGNVKYSEQLTLKKAITQSCTVQAKKLKVEMIKLTTRLEFIFPKGTDQYESIIKKNIGKLTAEQIEELAGNVLFIFETPNPMFVTLGITPETVAAFELEVSKLKDLIVEKENARSSFSIVSRERDAMRSEVFTYYKFVCKVAKAYWTQQNSAYYKDYNMYSDKAPPKSASTSAVTALPEVETPVYNS